MKNQICRLFTVLAVCAGLHRAAAQGTAFTYQGDLRSGSNAANGTYSFELSLYGAETGGVQTGSTITLSGVGVTNGLFTVTADFGAVFNGASYWLQIAVATNGSGTYTTLAPRQALTPAPYAVYAESAGSSALITDPGSQNFFAGLLAGNSALTGAHNTGVGYQSLASTTTGVFNSALGDGSLLYNTTGSGNTAEGYLALWQNTTGGNNTAVGVDSMAYNTSGSANTALGLGALENSTTGSYNVALGGLALVNNLNGNDNVAAGYGTLQSNTTGFQNTAIGYFAMSANTTGSYNTATGVGALENSVADTENAAFGAGALGLATTGSYNTACGANAMAFSSTGGNNTAVGYGALVFNDSGANNTAVGYEAAYGSGGGSAANTALGGLSIYGITTGYNNTAAGYESLQGNSTGADNVAMGVAALQAITTNGQNTALGTYAFQYLTSGTGNTGIGFAAGENLQTGSQNIYIGNPGQTSENNVIRIGNGQTDTYISGKIHNPVVNQITITGGSDLAEPFDLGAATREIPQGSVVVIDEQNPGRLKVSERAYDTHVAGVLSGANGINPGIQMHQEGMLEGGKNVALTGRVYVLADASTGAIKPGDMLTTSATPGHAMKVKNHSKAQGAILGKAMTGLHDGKGMVLVLVTLQ